MATGCVPYNSAYGNARGFSKLNEGDLNPFWKYRTSTQHTVHFTL